MVALYSRDQRSVTSSVYHRQCSTRETDAQRLPESPPKSDITPEPNNSATRAEASHRTNRTKITHPENSPSFSSRTLLLENSFGSLRVNKVAVRVNRRRSLQQSAHFVRGNERANARIETETSVNAARRASENERKIQSHTPCHAHPRPKHTAQDRRRSFAVVVVTFLPLFSVPTVESKRNAT